MSSEKSASLQRLPPAAAAAQSTVAVAVESTVVAAPGAAKIERETLIEAAGREVAIVTWLAVHCFESPCPQA